MSAKTSRLRALVLTGALCVAGAVAGFAPAAAQAHWVPSPRGPVWVPDRPPPPGYWHHHWIAGHYGRRGYWVPGHWV